MYHAACTVEFQPFNRSYSQLTFFIFFCSEMFSTNALKSNALKLTTVTIILLSESLVLVLCSVFFCRGCCHRREQVGTRRPPDPFPLGAAIFGGLTLDLVPWSCFFVCVLAPVRGFDFSQCILDCSCLSCVFFCLFTGSHSNQDPRCTQKPIYTPIFPHHMRS